MKSIHDDRVRLLNNEDAREGKFVLYWMQQSQRASFNPALEFAIFRANKLNQPLLVCFGLMHDYPDANLRHYHFMLQGLQDVQAQLKERNISFVLRLGNPPQVAIELGNDASEIVCDAGYLRHQRHWRKDVAQQSTCAVYQVEGDLVVPVQSASNKREYAARTIRPKLHKIWRDYMEPPHRLTLKNADLFNGIKGEDLSDIEELVKKLKVDRSVPVSPFFKGGNKQGEAVFRNFIKEHLTNYDKNRNQPQTNDISHMSMYLHFGHVSPVWLIHELQKDHTLKNSNVATYVEELLIRRELAANFVYYTSNYDSFECLPDWAKKTLEEHKDDPREHRYTREQLENAETHDRYWNACMREMIYTGFMHNYMRMYWGKRIIAWCNTPEYAYQTALYLNNKYFIDGRDFNSFTNIAWLFGNHDRPWQEREVFGKVRIMKASGLKRKFNPEAYIYKVDQLREKALAKQE